MITVYEHRLYTNEFKMPTKYQSSIIILLTIIVNFVTENSCQQTPPLTPSSSPSSPSISSLSSLSLSTYASVSSSSSSSATSVPSCVSLQKPILNVNIVNRSTVVNVKSNDFIDLLAGSELQLICEAPNNATNVLSKNKHLEWILPEFHPLYDDQMPEHVEVRESLFTNSSGSFVRSVLRLSDIQTSDVGHYSCLYQYHVPLISDENQLKNFPSLYVFVSDRENLFVKSIPILSAIYGRPIDLGCRPASSRTKIFLYRLKSTTGERIELPITNQSTVNHNGNNNSSGNIVTEFNPKRGFSLSNLTDDRFICRAQLELVNSERITQDYAVMIQYTNGVQYVSRPEVIGRRYAFAGENYTVSCLVEKSRSASVFLKWQLLNQSCYDTELFQTEVESVRLKKTGNDQLRLNVTVNNVSTKLDNASLECTISDVSMDQKVQQYRLRVYDSPKLWIVPREDSSQIVRCNGRIHFTFDIYSQPDQLDDLNITWLDPSGRQLRPDESTRLSLVTGYRSRKPLTLYYNDENDLRTANWSRNVIESSIRIELLTRADSGNYTLLVQNIDLLGTNGHDNTGPIMCSNSSLNLIVLPCGLADLGANYIFAVVGTAVILFAMLVFIIALVNRIKVERREKLELERLSYSLLHNGTVDSRGMLSLNLDPNRPVHEQVDMLRYDPAYEVAREDIDLGPVLGAGAFGQVRKARVFGLKKPSSAYRGMIHEQNQCGVTVAVKTLKSCASMDQLKSLLSELKTLTYIGRHVNIVNLLGACTANLIQGQLFVIVEYCQYGNLQHFLLKNRQKFEPISVSSYNNSVRSNPTSNEQSENQFEIDFRSKQRFRSRLAKLISRSRTHLNVHDDGRHGMDDLCTDEESSFSDNLPTDSAVVFLRRTPTGSLTDLSNVELFPSGAIDDDKFDSSSGIFTVQDLLNFAYQCSAGMEYLSSRKVIHRDLAARNVLLARGGIVKICDFGLARELSACDYSGENYVKKNDEPLPIKWMALESLRDKIYTTKSDVWSYGIFLWELFSLGATPYPGMLVDSEFYNKIESGYRMASPKFAPETIYRLMLDCWNELPEERPEFNQICQFLVPELDPSFQKSYKTLAEEYFHENSLPSVLQSANENYEQFDGGPAPESQCSKKTKKQLNCVLNTAITEPDYLRMNESIKKSVHYGIEPMTDPLQNSNIVQADSESDACPELNYIQMEKTSPSTNLLG